MQVEIYQGIQNPLPLPGQTLPQFPESDTQTSPALTQLKTRIDLCVKLGLQAQAEPLIHFYTAAYLRSTIPIPFPFISKQVEDKLATIFSTRYTAQPTGSFSRIRRTLKDYNYDFIPTGVLELWSNAVDQNLFHLFEIWTPERQPDPILVARRQEHPFLYLLCRWGNDTLLPWEEILGLQPRRVRGRRVSKGEYYAL